MNKLILIILQFLGFCKKENKDEYVNYDFYEVKQFDYELLVLVNAWRIQNNLNKLVLDQFTCNVSYSHSLYMAENKKASHDYFYKREKAFNGKMLYEAVGYNYSSAKAIFDAFKKSPGHNAVMLSDSDLIGISNCFDDLGVMYVTINCVKNV